MTHSTHDRIVLGDCLDVMKRLPDTCVDAIVTDPPYGLSFMGRDWDHGVPGVPFWTEALRVAKPGAHLLAFGGTRTYHRLACAIEDAGWEIRDCLSWLYGSGFPKSLDVSKAIDKGSAETRDRSLRFTSWMRSTGITIDQINAATKSSMGFHYLTDKSQPAIATAEMFDMLRPHLPDEVPEEIERLVAERTGIEWKAYKQRKIIGEFKSSLGGTVAAGLRDAEYIAEHRNKVVPLTVPATDAARQWNGWGTALKPAWEPIILARKPLVGTVAANVLAHGTGAINIDGCRIGCAHPGEAAEVDARCAPNARGALRLGAVMNRPSAPTVNVNAAGRWPANIALDEEAAEMLDEQTGERPSTLTGRAEAGQRHDLPRQHKREQTGFLDGVPAGRVYADSGGASRFFYTAKASRRERGEGNTHPTVKSLSLMRWLVRLVTPKGGNVLDPFAGSGTTLLAAHLEGFDYLGIEREAEYVEITRKRLARVEDLR